MDAPRITRRNVLRLGAAAFAGTMCVGVADSELRLTRRTLRLSNWREGGFRVAQVTDVHLNNSGELRVARKAIEMAVAEKPDLFVFTGDFVNYANAETMSYIVPAFAPLEDLKCPCLSILGNHDYANHNQSWVLGEAAKTKLRLLKNETFRIGGVNVVGLDDALWAHPQYEMAAGVPGLSTLVLLHEPDFVKHLPRTAALVLSGHSHGGEICLPGMIPIHTPVGSWRYRTGYYPDAPVPVYVNRGTATLGPARVYCPPEVAIFTLRPAG